MRTAKIFNMEHISIRYYARVNENGKGGWIPGITINGRSVGDTWSSISYDRDVALEQARVRAEFHKTKYGMGYSVTVSNV